MVLNILLIGILSVIAGAIITGKAINITIKHVYEQKTTIVPNTEHTEAPMAEDEETVRKEIAHTLQELWGLTDEE